MKKEQIYVPVSSKEQAEQYIKVLEAMGEKIQHDYFPFDDKTKRLCYVGGWYLSREKFTQQQITFGQLIDILNEPKKIAVKVENEKEFHALMKYYQGNGWASSDSMAPMSIKYLKSDCQIIEFNDAFSSVISSLSEYQIIPFSEFAKEHNIKLPLIKSEDGVWLYEGYKYFQAYLDCHNKWSFNKIFNGTVATIKINSNVVISPLKNKAFSNKKSALEWIEAQKPKEIQFDDYTTILNDRIKIRLDGVIHYLLKNEIESILKKMNELS